MIHNIFIYSMDSLHKIFRGSNQIYKYHNIYWNEIKKQMVPVNRFGRMYKIYQPILGVFGTSSKQGKFSLQNIIKIGINSMGYTVGALGTEPTALLLGFDEEYPMGYHTNVEIYEHESILYVNELLYNISKKKYDLILVGGQSNVLPVSTSNVNSLPCRQNIFLMAAQPDAIVLCINPYDEIIYVKRTISYLESLLNIHVIALVMFPLNVCKDWKGMYGAKYRISQEEFLERAHMLRTGFNIPVYLLSDIQSMKLLCEDIINYFSNCRN